MSEENVIKLEDLQVTASGKGINFDDGSMLITDVGVWIREHGEWEEYHQKPED